MLVSYSASPVLGVVLDAVPDAAPINGGSLLFLAAVAVAGLAAFVSQNFEPNPNARVSLGLEAASPSSPTVRIMWYGGGRAATRSTRV